MIRLNIPKSFIGNGFRDGVVIVPDGNHLRIYDNASFQALLHGISKPMSNAVNAVFRYSISNAVKCNVDDRFRIKIPRELAGKANIMPGTPVVLIGVKDCAELYDEEIWKTISANL